MPVKGTISTNPILKNKYVFMGPPFMGMITATKIGSPEMETEEVILPDRTTVSGGNQKTIEFTIEIPMHHTVDIVKMELWLAMAVDPVIAPYKYPCLIICQSLASYAEIRTWRAEGAWCQKRAPSDLDMSNEGEMAVVTYTIKADALRLQ